MADQYCPSAKVEGAYKVLARRLHAAAGGDATASLLMMEGADHALSNGKLAETSGAAIQFVDAVVKRLDLLAFEAGVGIDQGTAN